MTAFNPTAKQRANLAKLADFLATLPRDYGQFSMATYYENGWDDVGLDVVTMGRAIPCGSSACAIGHGPMAGIRKHSSDKDEWHKYSRRVFGTSLHDTTEGSHMFGTHNSDCPKAAAKRIREVLNGSFSDSGEVG